MTTIEWTVEGIQEQIRQIKTLTIRLFRGANTVNKENAARNAGQHFCLSVIVHALSVAFVAGREWAPFVFEVAVSMSGQRKNRRHCEQLYSYPQWS